METLKVGMKVYSYCFGSMTVKEIIDGRNTTGLTRNDKVTELTRVVKTTELTRAGEKAEITKISNDEVADRKIIKNGYRNIGGYVVLTIDDTDGIAPKLKEHRGLSKEVTFIKAAYGHWFFDSKDSIKDFEHQLENNDFPEAQFQDWNHKALHRKKEYRHKIYGGPEDVTGLTKENDKTSTGLTKSTTTGLTRA